MYGMSWKIDIRHTLLNMNQTGSGVVLPKVTWREGELDLQYSTVCTEGLGTMA